MTFSCSVALPSRQVCYAYGRETERERGRSAAACYAAQASKSNVLHVVQCGKRASASSVSARLFGKREKATAPRVHSAGLESFSWRERPRAESARESVCVTVYVRGLLLLRVRLRRRKIEPGIGRNLSPTFPPPLCRYRVISDIGHSQSVPRPD